MNRISRFTAVAIAACLVLGTPMLSARQQSKDNRDAVELVQKSMDVLRELTKVPEDGILKELLERAEGIVVIPSLVKGGFIIGAKHGKGLLSAKDKSSGAWSPPAIVKMTSAF